jgi:PAS domain S-box-containing protein
MLLLYIAIATLPLIQVLRTLAQALGATSRQAAFNIAVWDSLTAHIAVIDANGAIVATNRAWNRFAIENGGRHTEVCGRGANYLNACTKAVLAGDLLAQEALTGMKAVQDGVVSDFDLEYPCDSPSEPRWFAMHATRLGGQDRSLVVSHEDITARKGAERELLLLNENLERRVEDRTRELGDARRVALSMMQDADLQRRNAVDAMERLEESTSNTVMLWQAVENSPTIVIITDTEANIQYVNPKFIEVTGYSAEEVVGKTPRMLKSGQHPVEFYRYLWNTITEGKTWFGEFCNRKKNGELYWEAASISPVRGKDGRVHSFLAIKEDVTGIKRVAEELKQAKDAAEAANQAKSAFLASMSHEIRTPLNAILGYGQLVLRDSALSVQSRNNLQVINRSGEHLLALVNDVLEVSKIEAGRVELEPTAFDLHALLDDLKAMFRLRTMDKGLEFEVIEAEGLSRYVIADAGKLRQVLINLLGNAVKFTNQGRITVRGSVSRTETGQTLLALEVEDTGVGIAPEEMNLLFRYFEQTQSGRQTQSGTGLGLVISRDYARRMGGDLSVASEQGKGSVFRLEIPIAVAANLPAAARARERRVAGLAPGQSPVRALVADDNDTNRALLSALLESVGFEVREAKDGREAVAIWQAWQPALVLMDMRMPLMDGYEAARRIRMAPGGESTVIIALTASTFDERTPAILKAGVDDLVCKPFKEDHLFEVIRMRLGVSYRYDDSEALGTMQPSPPTAVTPASLGRLPAGLRARMRQATRSCDMESFVQILSDVAQRDSSLAAGLRTFADTYDYDSLARLLGEPE